MKYLFKVILLFLIIFNFKVPLVHYSCTVSVIIGMFYFLITKRAIPFTYFTSRYCFTILAATLLMAVVDVSFSIMHGVSPSGFYTRFIVQGWMLCCLVFVLPILMEKEETAFNEAMAIICGAFALQGLIHTLGFLIAPVGDFILNFQPESNRLFAQQNPEAGGRFRFFSLTGSPFFELPGAYGVACIMFFRLQLVPDQNYLRGWKAFVAMLFILLGIFLSGRTGYIGFGLGLLLYLYFGWNDISQMWRNVVKIAGGFLGVLIVSYIVLTPQQRGDFIDQVFPFTFEAYYNWRDTGKFETSSTDALIEVHYYYLDPDVILWGTGGTSDSLPGHRHTDAGYMNHILVGGIFYLLILIWYQWLYFRQPMRLARLENSKNGNINYFYFLLLFGHMFILEYKSPGIGTIHIIEVLLLYAGISYLTEQYALEDTEEPEEETLRESVFA